MSSELFTFMQLGFRHITNLEAMDHILFLLALAAICRPKDWRNALWVVTAFTVGHSITLALAVTGAMVLQATIPTAIALAFAPEGWSIQGHNLVAFASAAVAFASVAVIGIPMIARGRLGVRSLLAGGVLYLGYVGVVLTIALAPA